MTNFRKLNQNAVYGIHVVNRWHIKEKHELNCGYQFVIDCEAHNIENLKKNEGLITIK